MPGDDEDGEGAEVHWVSGPEPPPPELLCPAWLLVGSRLRVRGRVRVCGRNAWDVVVTWRPGTRDTVTGAPSDRVEAVVDAEVGIVQRLTFYLGGKPVRRYELRDIAASDEEFRADLPPGLTVTRNTSPPGDFSDGGLAVASAIGRLAAAGAGRAARNLLHRFQGRQPEDGG
ncbi:MAG TPA: hypothetical protein VH641_14805 [Streptosporangiaceae bacterium]|jgi:hypothetical protein